MTGISRSAAAFLFRGFLIKHRQVYKINSPDYQNKFPLVILLGRMIGKVRWKNKEDGGSSAPHHTQ